MTASVNTIQIKQEGAIWCVDVLGKKRQLFATKDAALRAVVLSLTSEEGSLSPIEVRVASSDGKPSRVAFHAVPGALVFN
jgi:hypothetical protein